MIMLAPLVAFLGFNELRWKEGEGTVLLALIMLPREAEQEGFVFVAASSENAWASAGESFQVVC